MPRLHFVKKARKDTPVCKAGESYYWWATRMKGSRSGTKHYSKEKPKASQLITSEYLRAVAELQEEADNSSSPCFDDLESARDEWRDKVQELLDAQQEKLDNMPEGLQQGDSGQLIQERIDSCEGVVSELDGIEIPSADDFDETEYDDEQEREDAKESWMTDEEDRVWEEITSAIANLC